MKFSKTGIVTLVVVCVTYFVLYSMVNIVPAGSSAYKNSSVCVVIDPGHGGEDGGTSSASGIRESAVNLAISKRLEQLAAFCGIKPLMIRDKDVSIHTEGSTVSQRKVSDLKKRVEIINSTENAVLLSIHQNHFTQSRYYGAQVFYAGTDGSRSLANSVQKALREAIDSSNTREIKRSQSVYLMEKINCTGILVECGFLSNYAEASLLQSPNYQTKLSQAIIYGLCHYLEEGK